MENAAYYGDIIEKNFAQCEEIHKRDNLTDGIAKQGLLLGLLEKRDIWTSGLPLLFENSKGTIQEGLEIMYLTSGQFAGVREKEYLAPQRLNAKGLKRKHTLFSFCERLVGITESDGGISIERTRKEKYVWSYYVDQTRYNETLLIYVKSILGVGKIEKSDEKMRKWRVREKGLLKEIIIPIFNQLPLMTSKKYRYDLWLEGMKIWESGKEKEEKVKEVEKIKEKMNIIEEGYRSREPEGINIDWLSGFVEGDGSFYIPKKEENRYVTGFGITQKLDEHILEEIRKELKINTKVREKRGHYILDTTNSRAIENIRDYFEGRLISRKNVEYKI